MNTKRLLKLAEKLETVNRKQFDISDWYYNPVEKNCGKYNCDTVACALGWAPSIPSFRRAGLTIQKSGNVILKITNEQRDKYNCVFNTVSGCTAGRVFFDLTKEQSNSLFLPSGYSIEGKVTPKVVARKIRSMVKTHLKELEKNKKNTSSKVTV